jgi:predicted nucleic acid-binding protein
MYIHYITKRPEMHTDTEILDDPLPRINLSTSDDIRREMARVYRETRFNKILPNNGSKLVYMLINILKAYEVTEIEKRLVDLEKAHLKRDK